MYFILSEERSDERNNRSISEEKNVNILFKLGKE
jgi:hypothetical protein